MDNKYSRLRWSGVVAAVAVCATLSGCWGDGDGDDDNEQPGATSQVPDSASQSTEGFIAYLQALVGSEADGLEPVDTSSLTAPTDDTSEPVAID